MTHEIGLDGGADVGGVGVGGARGGAPRLRKRREVESEVGDVEGGPLGEAGGEGDVEGGEACEQDMERRLERGREGEHELREVEEEAAVVR